MFIESTMSTPTTMMFGVSEGLDLSPKHFLLYRRDLVGLVEMYVLRPHPYANDINTCFLSSGRYCTTMKLFQRTLAMLGCGCGPTDYSSVQ